MIKYVEFRVVRNSHHLLGGGRTNFFSYSLLFRDILDGDFHYVDAHGDTHRFITDADNIGAVVVFKTSGDVFYILKAFGWNEFCEWDVKYE